MIERLTLASFQKHRKRVIEFDRRCTTIIGPTEAGKSTLLRALRWVALNEFDGPADEFIRWGSSFASVTLELDKEHKLTRRKGDKNIYTLDGKRFTAFGQKVPEEIEKLLAVSGVNFQQQHDAHFWFSLSPAEVSRQLNSIVSLSVIDVTLSAIASRVTKTRASVKLTQERLKQARDAKRVLAWVPGVEHELERLEKQSKQLDRQATERTVLERLVADVSEHAEDARNAGDEAARTRQLLRSSQNAAEQQSRAETLRTLLERVERAELVASTTIPDLPDATNLERLTQRKERLASLLYKLNEWDQLLCRSNQVCPACGRPLP